MDYPDCIAPWEAYSSAIFNVVIGDGITRIGANAFVNVQIDEVTIPQSVTEIGDYSLGYTYKDGSYEKVSGFVIKGETGSAAEAYATANGFEFKPTNPISIMGICGDGILYNLTIDGVLTISGTGSMYSYDGGNMPWYKYVSGSGDYVIREVVILEGLKNIGEKAFYGCTSLKKVTLAATVTSISGSAFEGCTALSEVAMPNSVVTIGNKAFSYCTSLKTISLSSSLVQLGDRAFAQSGLTEITLPASLRIAGETVFYGCESLVNANVSCEMLPPRIFSECTALKNVELDANVRYIGEYAFDGCISLITVNSTDSLHSIGHHAFEGCTSLSDIRFESSVSDFGSYCFKNCTSLTNFAFTDTITVIPEGMFYGCTSLSQVSLGDNIETIGDYAFVDCRQLAYIFISYKVRYIGTYALGYTYVNGQYNQITSIKLEIEGFTPSVAKIYAEEHDFNFTHYKTVDTDLGNVTETIVWKFRPSTGVLNLIGSGTMPDYLTFEETPWYVYRTYIKQVTFSSGILNIGSCAFEGCSSVEKIDIPASAKTIGTSAFAGTSIVTVDIPSGVINIANSAFEGCRSLYTVSLPNTIKTIGEAAFRGPNIMTSILIPQNIKEIGANAIGYNGNNTQIKDFIVKGIEGTIASSYADQNGLKFIVNGYVEITDDDDNCKISILGDSAFGYKLQFSKLQADFTPALLIPSDQTLLLYDIKLTYNDSDAKLESNAEISFDIPDGMSGRILYIYSVSSEGDFINIAFTNENGRIIFSNTSLGKYVISTVDLSKLYNITVNYVYADGTTAKDSVIARAANGAQYRFTVEDIKGFTLNEYAKTGTVNGEDVTISFVYTAVVNDDDSGNNGKDKGTSAGTRVLLTVFLIILIIALIAAVILLIFLNGKKKKQQKETGKTINAAAKKPVKHDVMAETIVVPDFATREIDIESLFADDPEEDLDAEENLRNKK